MSARHESVKLDTISNKIEFFLAFVSALDFLGVFMNSETCNSFYSEMTQKQCCGLLGQRHRRTEHLEQSLPFSTQVLPIMPHSCTSSARLPDASPMGLHLDRRPHCISKFYLPGTRPARITRLEQKFCDPPFDDHMQI